jgi:hypothetical protein
VVRSRRHERERVRLGPHHRLRVLELGRLLLAELEHTNKI